MNKDGTPPEPRTNTSSPNLLILIPFLVGLFISIGAPTDVLNNRVMATVYAVAQYLVPAVDKMEGNYERGQIVKLYFSVMWLMSPLVFCGAYRSLTDQSAAMFPKWGRHKILLTASLGVLFPAMAFVLTISNPESGGPDDARTYLIIQTKWGLPFMGFILPAGAASSLAMTTFWLKNFWRMFD